MNIRVTGLIKQYADKVVLNIPDLEIKSGSFWGIIGPNGSGKSTFLRILSSLTPPSAGQVSYDGYALNEKLLRSMTLVFQKPYLLRSTVYHNIAYPLRLRHVHTQEVDLRVKEMMAAFKIESLSDQKAWTLSGGEAQKVALARALVFRPRLLMLDEPTANIDPTSILLLEDRIRSHYEAYRPTVLMVTHNLQQTRRLCDQVAFMHEGQVHDSGPLHQVFGNEGHPLVASFIQQGLI